MTLTPDRSRIDGPALGRRTRLAVLLGRTAGGASRVLRLGSGGSIAGRVARSVDGDLLRRTTRDRQVVLVSGTNGKTTTTAYLSAALALIGEVATNGGGDNLLDGLRSTLVSRRGLRAERLVLEVDEAFLPTALEQTGAGVLVLLNLSRDQLDRHGEVSDHLVRWTAALAAHPATLCIANADDVLVAAAVLGARPGQERVVWVAAGSAWHGDGQVCPVCTEGLDLDGVHYRCPCGFRRPAPAWCAGAEGLTTPDGTVLPAALGLPGAGNRGNAVLAVATAHILGTPTRAALAGVAAVGVVQGRYSRATRGGRSVELRLAKNPAGWLDTLDTLADGPTGPLVLALNARAVDGTDPSWLWDVPFERLAGRRIAVTGERRADLAVRLRYADVEHEVCGDLDAALTCLPREATVVVGNYTAFQQARAWLGSPAA